MTTDADIMVVTLNVMFLAIIIFGIWTVIKKRTEYGGDGHHILIGKKAVAMGVFWIVLGAVCFAAGAIILRDENQAAVESVSRDEAIQIAKEFIKETTWPKDSPADINNPENVRESKTSWTIAYKDNIVEWHIPNLIVIEVDKRTKKASRVLLR